jgi:hypothetical protein
VKRPRIERQEVPPNNCMQQTALFVVAERER